MLPILIPEPRSACYSLTILLVFFSFAAATSSVYFLSRCFTDGLGRFVFQRLFLAVTLSSSV